MRWFHWRSALEWTFTVLGVLDCSMAFLSCFSRFCSVGQEYINVFGRTSIFTVLFGKERSNALIHIFGSISFWYNPILSKIKCLVHLRS